MRPGVDIISRAEPLPRSAPTNTGVCFMCGATEKGPTDPLLVRSLGDYTAAFGDRMGGTILYDAAETYFREGGSMLWVSAEPTTPDARATSSSRKKAAKESDSEASAEQQDAVPVAPAGLVALLDKFSSDYGPGQIVIPSLVDTASQSLVLAHCAAHNRVACLDVAPDSDAAALIAHAATLGADTNARYGALFGPQAIVPGVAGGTQRTVGYAAVAAGQCARSDALYPASVASAGVNGQSLFATDLSDRFTDQEYADLNEAGVDMARLIYGGVRTYGWRSLAQPNTPAEVWLSFGYARLNMEITAQAEAIGERYVFSQIDGRRRTISQFGGDLRAMLLPMWDAGALYGNTSEEAYQVDVGTTVNTDATIANGELHAVLMVKMSPFAEWVVIEIVKVATTEALAA